jgi:DNA (cytosine-5)-methyltransferase 1
MSAYYNEIDPYAAEWLRNLIKAGHIADGVVDTRSIVDVRPEELFEFTQCHFFAGIGIWSHALRSAGWEDDRPVWTGSCPCQPFSQSGTRKGMSDERHLWPHWHHLIAECRPSTVFGEQVASKDGLGWIDLVQADMEGEDYAFGAFDMCSAGFGAPHIRQRLWFVADTDNAGSQGRLSGRSDTQKIGQKNNYLYRHAGSDSTVVEDGKADKTNGFWRDADWLGCRDGKWRPVRSGTFPLVDGATARVGRLRAYGNAITAQVAQGLIETYIEEGRN